MIEKIKEKTVEEKGVVIAYWNDIRLDKKLIGKPVENDWGYSYTFITLPKNNTYDDDYGFFISSKLVYSTVFSLPNDYKIELQKNPDLRVSGRRYKRYKLSGLELKNTVFKNYIVDLDAEAAERLENESADRDRRNKKIIGRIVYGRYLGNSYGRDMEWFSDYFFDHNGSFSNERYEKVRNVKVEVVIVDNVSKYCYEKTYNSIVSQLTDFHIIRTVLAEFVKLNQSDSFMQPIITQLNERKDEILDNLKKEILKFEMNKE